MAAVTVEDSVQRPTEGCAQALTGGATTLGTSADERVAIVAKSIEAAAT